MSPERLPSANWRRIGVAASLGTALLLGCSGSENPVTLVLGSARLDFSGQEGSSNPAAVFVAVSASEGEFTGLRAATAYRAGEPIDWLETTFTSTSTPTTLKLAPHVGTLAAGTYHATVRVSSDQTGSSSVVVEVTFVLEPAPPPPPTISLPSGPIEFLAERGGLDPDSQSVVIQNSGAGTLTGISLGAVTYGPGEPSGWLGTRRLSGSEGTPSLTLRPNTDSLGEGVYHASVRVVAENAANSPSLPVVFTVTEPAPAALRIITQPGGGASGSPLATQPALSLVGSNGQSVAVAAISVTAAIDSGPGILAGDTLAVTDATGVAAFGGLTISGVGSHRLRFTAPDLEPATSAEFDVTPSASMSLSDTTIEFTGTSGGADPAPQQVVVSAQDGPVTDISVTALTYGAGQPTGWLTASPDGSAAPVSIELRASVDSLPVGVYDARVTIVSPMALNSPISIDVTFQVTAAPVIVVNPQAAQFVGSVGGGVTPSARTVTIENGGPGQLDGLALGAVAYGPGATGWLDVSALTSAVAPSAFTLGVDSLPVGVGPGTYTATIPVTSSLPGVVPVSLDVELVVSPAEQLCPSSAEVAFVTVAGQSPAPQTITVDGCMGSPIPFTIDDVTDGTGQPVSWLAVGLGVGSELVLTVTSEFLDPGAYAATVLLTSAQVGVLPADVLVTLDVSPAPQVIGAVPQGTAFDAVANGSAPAPDTVAIVNASGLGTLTGLSVTGISYPQGTAGWLTATMDSTTAPADLILEASVTGIGAGGHAAEVTIASTIPGVSPLVYPVTLTVMAPASIVIDPPQVAFAATTYRAPPAPQSVSITNGGDLPLTGLVIEAITDDGTAPTAWLDADLADTLAPTTLEVRTLTQSLDPGTYQGTIRVGSTLAGVASFDLAVTLVVQAGAPPSIALSTTSVLMDAPFGAGDPPSRLVDVTNGGDLPLTGLQVGSIDYVSGPTGWLTGILTSSSAPTTLVVDASSSGLPVGVYSATVTVVSTSVGVAPRTLDVTLNVSAPAVLHASSSTVGFSGQLYGPDPAPVLVDVTATGGAAAGLTAAVQPGGTTWLAASITGSTPGVLTLSPSLSGLTDGFYEATVVVSSSTPGVSPIYVDVTLAFGGVHYGRSIGLSDYDVTITRQTGSIPPTVYTTVMAGATYVVGDLFVGTPMSSGVPATWVTASLDSSSTPARLSVVFTGTGPGSHRVEIPVGSYEQGIDPRTFTIDVQYVSGSPQGVISTSTDYVPFDVHVWSPQQTRTFDVVVTNSGYQGIFDLTSSISHLPGTGTGWLSAQLFSSSAPATLRVTASTGSLNAGRHDALIVLQGRTYTSAGVLTTVRDTVWVGLELSDATIELDEDDVIIQPYPVVGSTTRFDHSQPVRITSGGTFGEVRGLTVTNQSAYWVTPMLTSTDAPALLGLRVDPSGLGIGTHSGELYLGMAGHPDIWLLNLTLRVFGFSFSADSAALTAQDGYGLSNATVGMVYEGNEPQIGDIDYAAGEPSGWLRAELCPYSGCSGSYSEIVLTTEPGDLVEGTYHATVRIDGSNPGVPSKTLPVTLTVLPPTQPVLGLSTHLVSFDSQVVGVSPAPLDIQVTNTGTGTIANLALADPLPAWLGAAFDQTVTPATLTLSPSVVGLAPGFYFTPLTVVGDGVATYPSINVVLTVPVPPAIVLSPGLLEFNARSGAANPTSKTVAITSTSSILGLPAALLTGLRVDSISYAGPETGWLTYAFTSTTAPATLRFQPITGSLTDTLHVATAWISSPVASNNPRSVRVEFDVGPPAIALSTSAVTLTAYSPQAQVANMTVTSGGAVLDDLEVGPPVYETVGGWLTATLQNGTATPNTLVLSAAMGTLSEGTYRARVDVISPSSSNSPLSVDVTFHVRAGIALTQSFVGFPVAFPVAGSSALEQTVEITNSGAGTLSGLTATPSHSWLTATLDGSTAPATLTVRASAGTLAPGTYNGTVTIGSPSAGNAPRTISVSYTITRSFANHVAPLITDSGRCTGCHGNGGIAPNLSLAGGASGLHSRLVNVLSACGSAPYLVVPGIPSLSQLYRLVGPAPYPCGGARFMPYTEGSFNYGNPTHVSLWERLRDWIREGAPNN